MHLLRHVKRLRAARPKTDFGTCYEKGCGRDGIVRVNGRGACAHHLDQLVREQAERAHAAFMRRIEQEAAS